MSPLLRALAAAALAAALYPHAVLAIGRYDARDGAECRAQVNANYSALTREMVDHGNHRGAAGLWERHWQPALEECEQMDRQARDRHMRKVHERLGAAIDRLRTTGRLDEEESKALAAERHAIEAYPDSPYRRACIDLFRDFERYVQLQAPRSSQCAEIHAALAAARREHESAVDALLRHEPAWRAHDERRKAAVLDLRFHETRLARAGCR